MRSNTLRALIAGLLCIATPLWAAPKIGVLLKGQSNFWSAMEKGALEAGKQLGAEVTVKAPPTESDVSIQIRFLNALAAQGAEAIVIAPINKEALAVPIASIAVKGVKIVVVDTPITGKAAPVFIGTDQNAAGKAGGELLGKLTTDSDDVSVLRHSQSSGATVDREAGAIAAFHAAHPNTTLHAEIYASAEAGTEMEKARLLLKQHPGTKAILAAGTPGTMAMLKVLQEQNLGGKVKLVGFGFNLNPEVAAAIENGTMSGWIAQLPKEVGAKGVAAAVALLKGEPVPAVVYIDFVVITKDNLNDPKVQALLNM
jgi:ribose transport system substrate-binding protein